MRLFYACAAGDPVNAKSLLETTDAFSQGVVLRDAHHRGRKVSQFLLGFWEIIELPSGYLT